MRTISSSLVVVFIAFTVLSLSTGQARAGVFEDRYGLRPAAIVIDGADRDTYLNVREVLRGIDAKGLVHMPPSFVFGYFPPEMTGSEFSGLDVHLVTYAGEAVPGLTDLVTRKAIDALFDQHEIIRKSPASGQAPVQMDHIMPGIPEATLMKFRGPVEQTTGAPSEIVDRGIEQNAEFLIGTVLVNVIFPESAGGSENWTDDEIGETLQYISVGLSQYIQATHWVDLEFFVHCPQEFRRVPVSIEPIEGDWNYDPYWINECMNYLDLLEFYDADPHAGPVGNTHLFNNATRQAWGTDWVFTSYMADASSNLCWQGDDGGYVAYTVSLGGPYQVVPYPACRFGPGAAFSHVFIHEMSHVFWALDEYASAGALCSARSGYLNVTNENSYYIPPGATQPCGYQLDCIMNNYELTEPMPICPWTMGQVGLGDYNENNIPDVYDIPPYIEMVFMPGVSSDTTYDGSYLLGAVASNTAVPNRNPMQVAATRVNYAPWLKRGWMQVNSNITEEINPGDGRWDEAQENLSFFLQEGLDPGDNKIYFIVENCVGLQAQASIDVTYIGMKFYQVNTESGSEYIDLSWITANQVFGAQFEIMREDELAGTGFQHLTTVDGNYPFSGGATRNYYVYRDTDVQPMHVYNYRIVSRIVALVEGEEEEFVMESEEYSAKSLIPVVSGIMSPVAPNPFDFSTSDRVEWTVKLPGEFDDVSAAGGGRSMQKTAAADEKIMLEVDIYNINGQKVRHLYALPVYGGRYKDMVWDGRNDRGQKVANGIYFIKVRAGSEENVKKVVVLR